MNNFGDPPAAAHRGRRTPAVWLATGLGLGFSPFAPGTVGTAWGILLAWGVQHLGSPAWELLVVAGLFAIGLPLCTAAARDLGGTKDPGAIVWDEIVSFPIAVFGHDVTIPSVLICGFLLHRLFDVLKPPPARQLESLPAGLGIMADDIMASVYANAALWGMTALGLLSLA